MFASEIKPWSSTKRLLNFPKPNVYNASKCDITFIEEGVVDGMRPGKLCSKNHIHRRLPDLGIQTLGVVSTLNQRWGSTTLVSERH